LDSVAREVGGECEEIKISNMFFDDALQDNLPSTLMAERVIEFLVTLLGDCDDIGGSLREGERLIDAGAFGACEQLASEKRDSGNGVVFNIHHILNRAGNFRHITDHVINTNRTRIDGILSFDRVFVRLNGGKASTRERAG